MSDTVKQTTASTDAAGETVSTDPRKVLVTGGTGFVGRYVVRELIARGYQPVCLVRDAQKLTARLTPAQALQVTTVPGDVFDMAALNRAASGCGAAIHLIGIIMEKRLEGQTFRRVHVEATQNVLAACRNNGVQRYAHMSALGTRENAVSEYHRTKWLAEEEVRKSGLNWTIFRPSVIHGPDGEFMEMMKFFSTSLLRQPVMPYFGSGENRLQPVSVRDVAGCFVRCLTMPETEGKTFDLGGPEQFTWKQLYDICAQTITGRKRLKVPVPVPLAKLAAVTIMPLAPSFLVPYKFNVAQVQMSQEDSVCDIAPIEQTFGIKLRSFREELAQYADQIR